MAHVLLAARLVTVAILKQTFGVKRFGGEAVLAGSIIVRQRGTKFNVLAPTLVAVVTTLLFAKADGKVKFEVKGPKTGKIHQHR